MKTLKRVKSVNMAGSGQRGTIFASIRELTELFGAYTDAVCDDSDGKVTTQWTFKFGRNYFEIYDYKQTALYSPDLPSLKDFRADQNIFIDWSVGAKCNADEFIELVDSKLKALRLTKKHIRNQSK